MLTTFGTFWTGEGLGVTWPFSDAFLLLLVALYLITAFILIAWLRQRKLQLVANTPTVGEPT
jgi:uncharacterized membrane protein